MAIKNRMPVCLIISGGVMLLALCLSLIGLGINLGIDFAGGMSMQYDLGRTATQTEVVVALANTDYSVTLQGSSRNEAVIRVKSVDEAGITAVQADVAAKLTAAFPGAVAVGDVNYVGPVAGATLIRNAVLSVLIAAALMLVYIAFRFDLNSGLAAVFGLIHDVLIMLSFMVILRSVVQMNSSFIAAALTIVGYSINNTIVIFDRIRENAKKMPYAARDEVVNCSVKESLGRTINTTLTTLITITALYVLGVDSIKEFALPIIIGIVSGAYSANMINGYVWAVLEERKRAKKA